jgi:hypothetical protein
MSSRWSPLWRQVRIRGKGWEHPGARRDGSHGNRAMISLSPRGGGRLASEDTQVEILEARIDRPGAAAT